LEVCVDLAAKGWHVFRAVDPSALCDLIALRGTFVLRIEVTTGYHTANGNLYHPSKDSTRFDVLAVCTPDGIRYSPEMPIAEPTLP
jgi:hypothetical protein